MEQSETLHEAWAAHEALRRLGFAAADIFFQVGGEWRVGHLVFIVLRAQGKEFRCGVGWVEGAPDSIEARWKAFAADIAAGRVTEAELERLWLKSAARRQAVQLITALSLKGFTFKQPGVS